MLSVRMNEFRYRNLKAFRSLFLGESWFKKSKLRLGIVFFIQLHLNELLENNLLTSRTHVALRPVSSASYHMNIEQLYRNYIVVLVRISNLFSPFGYLINYWKIKNAKKFIFQLLNGYFGTSFPSDSKFLYPKQ